MLSLDPVRYIRGCCIVVAHIFSYHFCQELAVGEVGGDVVGLHSERLQIPPLRVLELLQFEKGFTQHVVQTLLGRKWNEFI